MNDPALVLSLESRLVNAWPSFEYQFYDGWMLRLAKGYSKRANSASPMVPGAALTGDLLALMTRRFLDANVRPTFRLTSLEGPQTDALLAEHGFAAIEPTLVLAADTAAAESDPAAIIESKVSPRWVRETAAAYGGDKADDTVLVQIVSRIRQEAAFASLLLDERRVAWGLGVVERGWLGLYDIVVTPDLRGIGLGRRVVASLMAWGRERGAGSAYLQVREDNAVALTLYRSLGFTPVYRYTHRVMPGPRAA